MDPALRRGIHPSPRAGAPGPLQEGPPTAPLPGAEHCIADATALGEVVQIVDDITDVEALWADGPDTVKMEYPDAHADDEQQGAFRDLPNGQPSRLIQRLRAEYVRR